MAFEFLFADEDHYKGDQLHQGDVLRRGDALTAALNQAHQYYATAPDYTHFMVLTQSCDLVRRGAKKRPKSRYITLAAARPPEYLVERLIERYRYDGIRDDFPLPLYRQEQEALVANTLERLLHNTQEGYFFIPGKAATQIPDSLVVFLPLSVSLRADHYEACLSSKVAQLADVFQAKVGWLAGNQYSRVATPDIEEKAADADKVKESFYEDLLYRNTVWMTSPQYSALKTAIRSWRTRNPGEQLDKVSAKKILDALPTNNRILANRIVDQLRQNNLLADEDAEERALRLLENDNVLKQMTK